MSLPICLLMVGLPFLIAYVMAKIMRPKDDD